MLWNILPMCRLRHGLARSGCLGLSGALSVGAPSVGVSNRTSLRSSSPQYICSSRCPATQRTAQLKHAGVAVCMLPPHHSHHAQVISLCEKKRDPPLQYIVADTPGQIEIFTWSASGAIITEAFASTFPTMVAYVIDTPRCAHPQTFMSNMLQVWLVP